MNSQNLTRTSSSNRISIIDIEPRTLAELKRDASVVLETLPLEQRLRTLEAWAFAASILTEDELAAYLQSWLSIERGGGLA